MDFENILGGNLSVVLKKNEKSHEVIYFSFFIEIKFILKNKLDNYHSKFKEEAQEIEIKDLLIIKNLGKNFFLV